MSARAEVLTKVEDLASLRDEWEEMRLENGASIFTSHLWTCTWLEHFGKEVPPRVLVLREGRDVVGIAPLAVHRSSFMHVPATYLYMVGNAGETTEYHDLQPLHRGDAKEAARGLVAGMGGLRWNLLQLRDLRWTALVEQLFVALGERWPCERMISKPCPLAGLDPSRNVIDQFEVRSGRKVKRIVESLDKEGRIDFVTVRREEMVAKSMDIYIQHHKVRWEGKGGSIFQDPRQSGFLKDIATRSARMGGALVYEVHIDGKVASQQLCIKDGEMIRMYKIGMDDQFRSFAPGYLSVYYAMSEAQRDGFKKFDLGPGPEEYKYKVGGKDVFTHNIQGKRGTMLMLSKASRLPGARRVAGRLASPGKGRT